jgi:hypothetical protein
MLGRFAAKTAGLCCVVFGLAVFDPPRVVQEILYGGVSCTMLVLQKTCMYQNTYGGNLWSAELHTMAA